MLFSLPIGDSFKELMTEYLESSSCMEEDAPDMDPCPPD
jgi:hypothetical protein